MQVYDKLHVIVFQMWVMSDKENEHIITYKPSPLKLYLEIKAVPGQNKNINQKQIALFWKIILNALPEVGKK